MNTYLITCIRCGKQFPPRLHTGQIPFETRYCAACVETRVKERASQGFDNTPIVEKTDTGGVS